MNPLEDDVEVANGCDFSVEVRTVEKGPHLVQFHLHLRPTSWYNIFYRQNVDPKTRPVDRFDDFFFQSFDVQREVIDMFDVEGVHDGVEREAADEHLSWKIRHGKKT